MWDALSDKRTGLSFTIAAGPRQRTHSRIRVTWDSRPYFTLSDSRLPQPGGAGSGIYIPQELDGSVYPQELGSLFVDSYDSQGYGGGIRTRLHTGFSLLLLTCLAYNNSAGTEQKVLLRVT
jgi:hypothetical protein